MEHLELEARMARMERELRCWRWGLLAVCAVGLGLGTQRGEAQDEARGTVLKAPVRVVDAQGKEVQEISVLEGQPVLTLFGPDGNTGVRLVAGSKGGVLETSTNGKATVTLGATRFGGALITYGAQGKPSTQLSANEGGAGMVLAMNGGRLVASPGDDQAQAAELVGAPDGSALLIKDGKDHIAAMVAHVPEKGGTVLLDAGETQGAALLSVTKEGGRLDLRGGSGDSKLVAAAAPRGSLLSLFDSQGKVRFSAP